MLVLIKKTIIRIIKQKQILKNRLLGDSNPGYERGSQLLYRGEDYYQNNEAITNLKKSPSRWLDPGLRAWQPTTLSSRLSWLYKLFTEITKENSRKQFSNGFKNTDITADISTQLQDTNRNVDQSTEQNHTIERSGKLVITPCQI